MSNLSTTDSTVEYATDGIAIIGMAGRFPGADSVDTFWRNLCDGVESISFFSEEELADAGVDHATLRDPNYVRAQGTLSDIERFDASFFGITPREAEIMDPQHRIFLECAWQALEHGGYDADHFDGLIGLFGGVGIDTYLLFNLLTNQNVLSTVSVLQTSIRNRTDHLATNTAYKLNLKGPAVTVQTACSTSLVAVHLACQSLLNGEIDMSLAGGVSVGVPQKEGYTYQEGGIFSPDGHCRAFDANAGGTVGGSGAGMVLLKRLDDALADRDTIYAVIRGSAINNDGSVKVGYTAPAVDGQAEVIAEALAVAGVEPETISYVETHGTGTFLGDPIEIEALTRVHRAHSDKCGYCAIGAVKSNIGHLDTAAGVAGLIKTALSLKHGLIPPSLHFEEPNPAIDFANSPFYVNDNLADWNANGIPRRAGVSSFGIGGTNAHVVLEEAPRQEETGEARRPWQLLTLSAKTVTALERATENLAEHLQSAFELNMTDVAYTLQTGRHAFNHRRVIICQDGNATEMLDALDPDYVHSSFMEPKERPVVFMLTGQGAQYVNMGRDLYQEEPTFRIELDRCCNLLQAHLGFDLRDILYPPTGEEETAAEKLKQTYITQPALFAFEYALAQLWMEWGIQPAAMIGHSIGEYTAACLAGVFTLEEALGLVCARGRLMQSLPKGSMMSVSLSEEELTPHLGEQLVLAAVNSSALCVVSGPDEAVDMLEAQLTEDGIGCRRLRTSHAFHSPMMDPILEPFIAEFENVTLQPPQIPFISNVTGTWISEDEATDPHYWAKHLRQTVRFADGVHELVQHPDWILLEVGPGWTLMSLARWHPLRSTGQIALTSVRQPKTETSDMSFLLVSLGRLWLAGSPVDWDAFHGDVKPRRVPLPSYPFERRRYWVEPGDGLAALASGTNGRKPNIADWFYTPSWKRSAPLLTNRELLSEPVNWLLFTNGTNFDEQLVQYLTAGGQQVIQVHRGDTYAQRNDGHFELNPQRREEYEVLVNALREQGQIPAHILYLWSMTPAAQFGSNGANGNGHYSHGDETKTLLQNGFYSLLYIAQAIGSEFIDVTDASEGLRIGVITNEMHEVLGEEQITPEKAAVIGACRAITKEYPGIACRSIDVMSSHPQQEASEIEQIINELMCTATDPVIAYRGQHRWVQTFDALSLPERDERPPLLRDEGVYLITGGLGGIGLELANYLAEAVQAKLILTSRSTFPERADWERWLATYDKDDDTSQKIRKLQALEQKGAEVLVCAADVTDEVQMQHAVERVHDLFGPIHGVIHAAGNAGGGMVQLKTVESSEPVLAPKIEGTRLLESVLRDEPLDFFILCSSRASILGGFGQADYVAANAFLDAFAQSKVGQSKTQVISINWPGWDEVGMRVKTLSQLAQNSVSDGAPSDVEMGEDFGHPLLERRIEMTPEREVFSTIFNIHKHWVIEDHRIMKRAVIPGVAYVEMATAALMPYANGRHLKLRDIFFLTALDVQDDESKEVRTIIEKVGEGYSFRMMSEVAPGDWREHVLGKAEFIEPDESIQHNMDDFIARCQDDEILATDEPLTHDDLGPRWQILRRVWLGKTEMVNVLDLPDEFAEDLEHHIVHPAILDRTNGAAKIYLTNEDLYMPMAYRSVTIKAPLPAKVYAYHIFNEHEDPSWETISFDAILMDEAGNELVVVDAFSQKKVNFVADSVKRAAGALEETPAESISDTFSDELETDEDVPTISGGILSWEGVEVFQRVLHALQPNQQRMAQLIVSPDDFLIAVDEANAHEVRIIADDEEEGDVTRSAHPRPNITTEYVAPRTDLEQQVADIWGSTLGIDEIGIHDNFFDLGGDSVVGIQMITKFNRAGFTLSPQQLFQYQTVAELAAVLGGAAEDDSQPKDALDVQPADADFWLENLGANVLTLPVDFDDESATPVSAEWQSELDANSTKLLLDNVLSTYRVEVEDVLMAALLQGYAVWSDDPSLLVQVARSDANESNFSFPLLLHVQESLDGGEQLKAVKELLRQVPNRGVSFEQLLHSEDVELAARLDALPKPELLFSHATSESAGNEYLLTLSSSLDDGSLHLKWRYRSDLYEQKTIEELDADVMTRLRGLIQHGQSGEASEFTPSDFAQANVDQGQLDAILEQFQR